MRGFHLGPSGQIGGSYVYLLLCKAPEDDYLYARFGCADSPVTNVKRQATFPAPPWALACAHVWSRAKAEDLKAELYHANQRWAWHNGWLVLRRHHCPAFRLAWRAIFLAASTSTWRLRWTPVKLAQSRVFQNVWIDPDDRALA